MVAWFARMIFTPHSVSYVLVVQVVVSAFLKEGVEALKATPLDPMAASGSEIPGQQLQEAQQTAFHQAGVAALYQTKQQSWFEEQRVKKRGPPSTVGITSSGLTTPQEDVHMESAEATRTEAGRPRTASPFDVDQPTSYELTAIQAGVDARDPAQMQTWLQGPITTRQEVLETVRAYHTGVIRTEIQQMVTQVETVVKGLNDRLLRQHDHLRWLTTESRMDQKKLCGVQVLLNGFDAKMGPEERLYMISWMFEQVEYFRSYLKLRAYDTESPTANYVFLNVLQSEPATNHHHYF